MTDIVELKKKDGVKVYPQTHAQAVLGLETIKGEKGDKGDQGVKGDTGTSATIAVGTVTSGTTPSVTNVGTTSSAKFNFVLAKGDKGDQGVKGDIGQTGAKGDKGDPGVNATTTLVATTTTNGLMSSADKTKLNQLEVITIEVIGSV